MNCLVTGQVDVTERGAGVQLSLYREVDVNGLFCNSKENNKIAFNSR